MITLFSSSYAEGLASGDWVVALIALTAMEIVLGIDNIIFIAIVTDRLPEAQRRTGRNVGIGAALVMRILLLLTLNWIMRLDEPIFRLSDLGVPTSWFGTDNAEAVNAVSWKDIILIGGGLFLIGKSVHEIHAKIEGDPHERAVSKSETLGRALVQIALLDIIFSLDSVITAVGMADRIEVMIAAVIMAVGVMLVFAGPVSSFVSRHPTLKMLALSFLILIGVMLVAEGIGKHIEKGYIYSAMSFALIVEFLNLRVRALAKAR